MTNEATAKPQPDTLLGLGSSDGLGPLVEPATLADVLDALNVFNRPKPSEDEGPWEGEHYIRVDHLPAFINSIAAAWFAPEAVRAAERERFRALLRAEQVRAADCLQGTAYRAAHDACGAVLQKI